MSSLPQPLPDVIDFDLKILFCGLNPGLKAVATGHHFEGRGNRFWPVLQRAGITPHLFRPQDDRSLLEHRCGLTTVVPRPTAGADEVLTSEFQESGRGLETKIQHYRPSCIAFLGKAAYGAIRKTSRVEWGRQPIAFGGAVAWVLPNPSGRNLTTSTAMLVEAYRELWVAMAEPSAALEGDDA
jgi:TDG/mug DNA glycosylase family protein